jgi:hypothetical protein
VSISDFDKSALNAEESMYEILTRCVFTNVKKNNVFNVMENQFVLTRDRDNIVFLAKDRVSANIPRLDIAVSSVRARVFVSTGRKEPTVMNARERRSWPTSMSSNPPKLRSKNET